jgi:hypothetical protein
MKPSDLQSLGEIWPIALTGVALAAHFTYDIVQWERWRIDLRREGTGERRGFGVVVKDGANQQA